MVTIKDGCGCDPCDCDWKQKLKEAYARASVSVNKIGDFDGSIYFPDGTGFVKIPIPKLSEVQQISTNAQDIADLKVADIQLQANITAEETARKTKDDNLDSDVARIDATDARQSELIQDNADRINSTYNDLVATEATVATHDSEIITLQANNQALAKSLVSDVIMTDGTTAGSVQVSIKREDGALITSAGYRWGKDIGIRLEAGTQAGYVKAVISLSDGTELVSNEYKIVEVLESDVYVTAITLIADQAAGTLGGNISYSNGTTQTINSVSVPTAPGVTSAIETLQSRMTAVEQKNTQQDSSISALDSRIKAIEDTPGVGQFAAGKLGTIAGSTTDGRIKAEDDGTGSVNGWSELKQRVTTAEGQIVSAQNDITNIDTEISGIMSDITDLQNRGSVSTESYGYPVLDLDLELTFNLGNVTPSGTTKGDQIDYNPIRSVYSQSLYFDKNTDNFKKMQEMRYSPRPLDIHYIGSTNEFAEQLKSIFSVIIGKTLYKYDSNSNAFNAYISATSAGAYFYIENSIVFHLTLSLDNGVITNITGANCRCYGTQTYQTFNLTGTFNVKPLNYFPLAPFTISSVPASYTKIADL